MEVKYRIVEEITPEGEWEVVGVIALWLGDPPHLQLRGMLQHTVSRAIWNKIRQRVKENELTLETYHEALTGYEHNYRIQTDIHTSTHQPQQTRGVRFGKNISLSSLNHLNQSLFKTIPVTVHLDALNEEVTVTFGDNVNCYRFRKISTQLNHWFTRSRERQYQRVNVILDRRNKPCCHRDWVG